MILKNLKRNVVSLYCIKKSVELYACEYNKKKTDINIK